MNTAIITSDSSEDHITGDGHPEQPKRVSAVINKLRKRDNLLWIKSEKFDQKILKKVQLILFQQRITSKILYHHYII